MNNNKKEDLVFISFDRLWDNFIKYCWIAFALMIVLLVYGAGTYNNKIAQNEAENIENRKPVIIADDPKDRVHIAETSISFSVNVPKYLEMIGVSEKDVNSFEVYTKLCTEVASYANAIASTEGFHDKINTELEKTGHEKLDVIPKSLSDDEYDTFIATMVNDTNIAFSVSGLGGVDRIKRIGDVAVNILADSLSEQYPFIECNTVSSSIVSLRIYAIGFYKKCDPSEESVAKVRAEYEEYNKMVTNQVEKFDFQFKNIFKVSTIIKGVVGFVLGLFIIFIIAVCDKKVRTRDEVERFFDNGEAFLGEIKKNDEVSEDITAESIGAICRKTGYSNVVLTTVGKAKNMDVMTRICEKASSDNVEINVADGIEVCAATTKTIAGADATIVLVNSGYDDIHTIKNALSRLYTIDANLVGYVLCR